MYPPLSSKMTGGSELLLRHIAKAMVEAGHRVDCIATEPKEQILEGSYWWTTRKHPVVCDVYICFETLEFLPGFEYKRAYASLNRIDPTLAGDADKVEYFVTFGETHKRYLLDLNKEIPPERVKIIGPGVDIPPWQPKKRNQVLYCNAPGRGLVHFARMWDKVVQKVPDATLALTYNLERDIRNHRWKQNTQSLEVVEMMQWIRSNPKGVVNHGELSRPEALRVQAESELYAYPCDPPGVGTCVHCFAAMEAAAAGNALLLAATEGLPEIYKDVATFLSYPIREAEWPDAIEEILGKRSELERDQHRNRKWARKHPWSLNHRLWQELVTAVRPAVKEKEAVAA